MIEIDKLEEKDVGRYVVYKNYLGNEERGRIKRWNDKWIFVVYHCADEWDNYQDYTAAATDPRNLEFSLGSY